MVSKKINITIIMDELLYDIMNETYLRGNAIQSADNYKEVAKMYATMDEENHDKIMRSINKGYSDIKLELAEYLIESVANVDNRLIADNGVVEFKLAMPFNFNESATVAISEAIHDYIKNIAVAEWYLVVNKEEAADYLTIASASLVKLQQSLCKRSRPMRRY